MTDTGKNRVYIEHGYGAIPLEVNGVAINSNLSISDDDYELNTPFKRKHNTDVSHQHNHSCCLSWMKYFLSIFMLMLGVLLAYLCASIVLSGSVPFHDPDDNYDFIVIGAGPAGCVVTNKLVNEGTKVLLLEAGGSTIYDVGGGDAFGGPVSRFDIPLLWSSLMTNRSIHWTGYNIHGIVEGKGLGGSGIHTAMIYMRGIEEDFEKWGLAKWSWETMLQHYIALEDYGNHAEGNEWPSYHGRGNGLRTTKAPYIDSVAVQFIASALSLGIEYSDDFNDPKARKGVGYYDFNIRDGVRDSAVGRFLYPVLKYRNLNVQTEAFAHKVILKRTKGINSDEKGNSEETRENIDYSIYTATGVQYERDGMLKTAYIGRSGASSRVFTKQGVIVTTGALLTPKLLMNSGIGPAEVLKRANIEVLVDSPHVGRNAQDHGATQVLFRLNNDITAFISKWGQYLDAVEKAKMGIKMKVEDFGSLGSSGLAAGAFLTSPFSDGRPDIQLTVFPSNIFDHGPFSSIKAPHFEGYNKTIHPNIDPSTNVMAIAVALMYSDTRYEITLNSTDPIHSPPYINSTCGMNAFALEDIDLLRMAWGIDQVRRIATTAPLSNVIEEIISPPLEITIDMLPEWVLQNHHPYAHWVGSARMGKSIEDSVLDENTKVHGVHDLYVADASAAPLLTNGNIHALVTAVASRAVDLILQSQT